MNPFFTEWQIIWQTLVFLAYILLLGWVRRSRPQSVTFDAHLSWPGVRFAAGMLIVICALGAAALYAGLLDYAPRFSAAFSAVVVIYIFAIIAPAEEILFRGIIQRWFTDRLGVWGGILVAGILFAAMHLPNGATGLAIGLWNWKLTAIAGLAGIGFGWTYARTKNIWYPIIIHAIVSSAYFLFLR